MFAPLRGANIPKTLFLLYIRSIWNLGLSIVFLEKAIKIVLACIGNKFAGMNVLASACV
jgi:hypothetical protein